MGRMAREQSLKLRLEGRFLLWIASVFLLMNFAGIIIRITPTTAAITFFVVAVLLLVSVIHYFVLYRRMAPIHMCLYILAVLFVVVAVITVGVTILRDQ